MTGMVVAVIVVLYLSSSIRILRQYERGVVFLLGKFTEVRGDREEFDHRLSRAVHDHRTRGFGGLAKGHAA